MRVDHQEITAAGRSAWAHQAVLWSDVAIFLTVYATAFCLGAPTVAWGIGVAVGALGFCFWMLARHQLGQSFSIAPRAEQLVETGLYRRFRHPIYLFGGLAYIGAFVALQNWWILAAWLAYAAPIQWSRIRRENQVMTEKFGDAFLAQRRRTWL